MADLLDELVAQIARDTKERHAKMTPEEIEEEHRRNEMWRKRGNWLKAERKYMEKFVDESRVNGDSEIQNCGKLVKHFYGDTTLLRRTITKLYVFNILTICAILALLLFYPIKWGIIALIVVMIIGNWWYISDYRTYRMQKYCFLDVYENAVCGYALHNNWFDVVNIGFSTVKWISIKNNEYDVPTVIFKTINGDIKFLYLKDVFIDADGPIITSQPEAGIENRSRCWTKHKIDWVSKMADSDELWDD